MKINNLLTFMLAAGLPVAAGAAGRIIVDTGTKGHDIGESMYGIFFEEINHSGDGGLYAELIQNRGFEEHVLPSGTYYQNGTIFAPQNVNGWNDDRSHNWTAPWDTEGKRYLAWTVKPNGCTVKREVKEMATPLHANTPNAMQLVITGSTDGSTAQLINEGYWGVAVKDGDKYDLRFYLRTADYKGNVVAMVCDNSGKSIGELTFDVTSDGQWTEYTGVLAASKTVADGTFRLLFAGDGTIDVDYVSLFPQDTFHGRKNGLRRDIAETLEALNPKFLRWPGGCIVEGVTLENRVKWKETLGDPMTRRGEFDSWGYRCTWGLGYHESLLFCEDLGMDMMFVGNLGMACAGRNADYVSTKEDLQPFIDDIRDAIEYAIGDPTTNKWAKMRADAGHPEKFSLKYVELGNENWGNHYARLFNWAYEELKAEYPQLTFINTMAHYDAGMANTKKTDMVDPHWYKEPDWFYNTSTFEFDNVDRNKTDYTIYVGEYACNEQVGSGNLDAALSESVFMINMERNSDIVKMTSYAPLISNQNRPDWACNLIWVNSDQCVGRASYHAQQLFANNRPDHNVRSKMVGTSRPPYAGRIALGTFATTAEFRNVKCTSPVDGRVLYQDDLSKDNGDWSNPARGNWVYEDGVLKQTNLDQSTYFTMDRLSFNDVIFEVECRRTGGNEGFLINFGCNDEDINHSWRFNIGGWGNTGTNLEEASGYWGATYAPNVPMTLENNRWYKVKLVGHEGVIRCYIDDVLIQEYNPSGASGDVQPGRLSLGAGYDKANGEIVLKVVNATADELTTDLTLNAENIASTGQVTVLAGAKLYMENSFQSPDLLVPQTEEFTAFAKEFRYTFKPYSLTIMRVKADEAATAYDMPQGGFTDEPVVLATVANTPLARAEAMLDAAIARAEYGREHCAKGSEMIVAAIDKAKAARDKADRTAESIYTAFDQLCVALEAFYQANMDTESEWTVMVKNAKFDSNSYAGWLGSAITLGCNVAEYFNGNFGIVQKVDGLPNGSYLLTMQGFYRPGIDGAWEAHSNRTERLNAILSANDQSVPVRSMFSTEIGEWSMAGAEKLFRTSETSALNYLVCEVVDGTLTIALEKETTIDRDWVCFDNFRLYRVGDATGIEGIEADSISADPNSDIYDISGRKVGTIATRSTLQPGIYVTSGRKIVIR